MLGKDSAEGIATELVGAGLVDGRDIVVIAANLQKLISSNGQMRQVTFPLVSVVPLRRSGVKCDISCVVLNLLKFRFNSLTYKNNV